MNQGTPIFDTPPWREMRDKTLREIIPDEWAVKFIIDYGQFCEVWDDLIDGDKFVSKEVISDTFRRLMTEWPMNPFFDRNKITLSPLILTGINAWLDANDLEARGGDNDTAVSYMLRDFYMELVNWVVFLTTGWSGMREASMRMRDMFTHETLEQYRGRFDQ